MQPWSLWDPLHHPSDLYLYRTDYGTQAKARAPAANRRQLGCEQPCLHPYPSLCTEPSSTQLYNKHVQSPDRHEQLLLHCLSKTLNQTPKGKSYLEFNQGRSAQKNIIWRFNIQKNKRKDSHSPSFAFSQFIRLFHITSSFGCNAIKTMYTSFRRF